MEQIMGTALLMMEGAQITLEIFCVTLLLSLPLGLLVALCRISKLGPLRLLMEFYIWLMRGTPLMLQLLFVYFALPMVGIRLPDIAAALLAFTLNYAAYFAEIFRAGLEAVPKGQYEAAVSIGLSPWQAVFRVVLPQAAVIALPNFGNATINLMKEGALAYTIGLIDLIGQGSLIIAQNFGAYGIETYTACMLIYWILTLLIEQAFALLERRLDKGQSFAVRDAAKRPGFLPNWMKGGEAHGA